MGSAAGRAMAQISVAAVSLAVKTVALLVTPGTAAAPTATVRLKLTLSPTAIGPAFVAVTIWPLALKDQLVPAPPTNVRPAGSVSSTVIAPVVARVPRLVRTKV